MVKHFVNFLIFAVSIAKTFLCCYLLHRINYLPSSLCYRWARCRRGMLTKAPTGRCPTRSSPTGATMSSPSTRRPASSPSPPGWTTNRWGRRTLLFSVIFLTILFFLLLFILHLFPFSSLPPPRLSVTETTFLPKKFVENGPFLYKIHCPSLLWDEWIERSFSKCFNLIHSPLKDFLNILYYHNRKQLDFI